MSSTPQYGRPSTRPVGVRGQCPECRHVRVIRSATGSEFLLCERAKADPAYRRYAPQPQFACPGFER